MSFVLIMVNNILVVNFIRAMDSFPTIVLREVQKSSLSHGPAVKLWKLEQHPLFALPYLVALKATTDDLKAGALW